MIVAGLNWWEPPKILLGNLTNNYIEFGRYIEKIFPMLGVRFIAINDNYDSLIGKSQTDEIVIPFKNFINE